MPQRRGGGRHDATTIEHQTRRLELIDPAGLPNSRDTHVVTATEAG
jgi:hypothetical protein